MLNVTLKQLRYFEAVSRERHFGRAAASCAVSQPALSMQIKELEEMLGVALFERGARHVRLTRIGEDLADRVRDILRAVDEIGDVARASARRFAGRLRLGVIPTVAPYLLPQVIQSLGGAYPDLDLYVRETITPKLIEELGDGRLDAAIVALPISEPAFEETALFDEPFVLIRPIAEASRPAPSGDELREMELLLLEEGHCFRDQALEFCGLRPQQPREGLDGSSLSTLVQMVGSGIGVTLIPDMAVPVESRMAEIDVVRFGNPAPRRTVGIVWRKSTPLAGQLSEIADLVRGCATGRQRPRAPAGQRHERGNPEI